MVVGAAVCVAGQFVFMKLYQAKVGGTPVLNFTFSAIAAVMSCFLFLCIGAFDIHVSVFTVCMALGMSFACTLNSVLGIFAVSYGKLSIFTMSMMLGGMLLPFLYGLLFLGEPVTVWRIVGCILLVAALIFTALSDSNGKKKNKLFFYGLCVLVFISNGAVSIISKCHQISEFASGTIDYCVMTYAFMFGFSALALGACVFFRYRKGNVSHFFSEIKEGEKPSVVVNKPLLGGLTAATYAVISGGGYFLQLYGAVDLPASVLYPIVTGGSIVLTALFGRVFFKENITWKMWIGFAVTLAATILFLF